MLSILIHISYKWLELLNVRKNIITQPNNVTKITPHRRTHHNDCHKSDSLRIHGRGLIPDEERVFLFVTPSSSTLVPSIRLHYSYRCFLLTQHKQPELIIRLYLVLRFINSGINASNKPIPRIKVLLGMPSPSQYIPCILWKA
jgi:hypothetical protein